MQPGLNFLDTDFSKIDFKQIKANAFFYGADINNGRKFSKMNNLGVITVIESGGSGTAVIPITFAALKIAQTGNLLITDAFYLITDFQTIYDQPDYDAAGNPKVVVVTKTSVLIEPLLVQAISNNGLAKSAFSAMFPTDTIEYDANYIVTEHMAAPAKGRISLRETTKANIADYDQMTILFLRYELAPPGSGIFNVVKDNGGATREFLTFDATNNIFNNVGQTAILAMNVGFPFLLSNNIFGANSIGNNFGGFATNNTFLSANFGNYLVGGNSFISLQDNAQGNVFQNSSNNIIGLDSFQHNTIGVQSSNINFGSVCSFNTLGDNIGSITLGSNCTYNEIGENSGTIIFGNNCNNNTLGKACASITFGNSCINNFLNILCATITVGDNFNNNSLGIGCSNGTSPGPASNCILGNFTQFSFGSDNTNIVAGNNNTLNFGNSNTNVVMGNNNTITIINGTFNSTFGNNNQVSLGTGCTNNTFNNSNNILTIPNNSTGNNFGSSNSDGGSFSAALLNNIFGDSTFVALAFGGATHVYNAYSCTIFINATPASRLSYFDALDILTVVSPTA